MPRKRIKRFLRFFYFSLIITIMFFFFLLPGCLSFRISQKDLEKKFKNSQIKPVLHNLRMEGRKIHYAEIGKDSAPLPLVFFVHGSPGSWSAWIDFFKDEELLQKVKMVAPDRPGFGESDYGQTEISLQKQAACMKAVLEKYQTHHPLILIGHSLGGPLIAQMAMDYPDLADALIFVAPSIDPELEKVYWYQRAADWSVVRWALPGSIKASNQEILPLKGELEKMLPHWKDIRQRCIYIHGTEDSLVPVENTNFAKKMLKNAKTDYIIIEGMSHFVPWQRPELIKKAILKLLDEFQSNNSIRIRVSK